MEPFLTLAEAARRIASGVLSPIDLVADCLRRVDRLNPQVSAFVTVTAETAMAAARRAQDEIAAHGPKSRLHGIPIGLKDVLATRGIRTTAQSRHLQHHVPAKDAAAWICLRDAGAILVGKTATHEFAFAGPSFDLPWPPARNPWDTTRFAAGSSSGNAVGIACGMMLGGVGSDTGGSIRGPAALCGVTGLKPTFGLVSRRGVFPTAFSLDHVGPMAWSVEDCAILLQEMACPDPNDPTSVAAPNPTDYCLGLDQGVRGLRIGVVRHFFETDSSLSPAMAEALEAALDVFQRLGADIRTVTLPALAEWKAVGTVILLAEAYAIHEKRFRAAPDLYGELMRDQLAMGALISAADYIQACRRRGELAVAMTAAMCDIDILAGPTQAGEAPLIDRVPKWRGLAAPSHTLVFNMTGAPALSLCCGFGEGGLPLSLQLAAKPFDEATLLRAGHSYQTATEWRDRRPALAVAQAEMP
jgi:aspartyl-tRNA(Asn)/glutamyl-tRNA(Gln) amidotransferase subunit A